jgi:predicted amidophosphoribosyltransferase
MHSSLSPGSRAVLFPSPLATPRILDRARAFGGACLDLIAPPHCASCQSALPPQTNAALCETCAAKIRWIGADRCRRCGDATGEGSGVRDECPSCRTHPPAFVTASCAVSRYLEGPIRDVVLGLKFGGQVHLAKLAAQLMAQRLKETDLILPNTVVLPVPPARRTWASRGRA